MDIRIRTAERAYNECPNICNERILSRERARAGIRESVSITLFDFPEDVVCTMFARTSRHEGPLYISQRRFEAAQGFLHYAAESVRRQNNMAAFGGLLNLYLLNGGSLTTLCRAIRVMRHDPKVSRVLAALRDGLFRD